MQIRVITLTRKQLYDEVWKVSAAGVSKKYDIPYVQTLKQIKEAGIPIPPSGYWAQLNSGKTAEKPELPGSSEETVSLYKMPIATRKHKLETVPRVTNENSVSIQEASPSIQKNSIEPPEKNNVENCTTGNPTISGELPDTIERYGQVYNVYDRETLYQEVWAAPATEVAKKYKVSDDAIHKVCKSLEIPTPSLGYWAKLRAGKSVTKTPLPNSDKESKKTGIQTGISIPLDEEAQHSLDFLSEEDRTVVLTVAAQIRLPEENERMHSTIIAYRKVIAEWKKNASSKGNNRWQQQKSSPPYLADTIANDSTPRACHIIDALIKAMEPLGCKLTEQLAFVVNGEQVSIAFSESQDKVTHVPTKEENRRLLEYEERRKKYSFETKPQIKKFDYQYNGRMSLTVTGQKSLRDCRSYKLEDRLGDVLLELFIAAERLKQQRLAREEAERKRQEEAARREERRKRYNEEVDMTIALKNEADDYDIACKIRAYIDIYSAKHADDDISEWVAWAKAKADWHDPTVSLEDVLLGKRDHGKDEDAKKPKHAGYWW